MEKKVLKQAIGIDIAKDSFQVCYSLQLSDQVKIIGSRTFKNTSAGFSQFIQWADKKNKTKDPIHYLMEATGVYGEKLATFLYDNNQKVYVVPANRAKLYIKSLGLKSKTDKIDAKGIAQMMLQQVLSPWEKPDESLMLLRKIIRRLDALNQRLLQANQQKHAEEYSSGDFNWVNDSIDREIAELKKEQSRINEYLKQTIDTHPDLSEQIGYMTSIPGVGWKTAACVLAETNGFNGATNAKQVVSYAGLDVVQAQSGDMNKRGRMSKKGNPRIRKAMFLPSLVVVRYNKPHFIDLYNRLTNKGKRPKQAYVAIQRKLLMLMFTLWKTKTKYDPNYEQNKLVAKEETTP